jgi:hypothetical protein
MNLSPYFVKPSLVGKGNVRVNFSMNGWKEPFTTIHSVNGIKWLHFMHYHSITVSGVFGRSH